MFIVITVAQDDPYGAEWVYGPFDTCDDADAYGVHVEHTQERLSRTRAVLPVAPRPAHAGHDLYDDDERDRPLTEFAAPNNNYGMDA